MNVFYVCTADDVVDPVWRVAEIAEYFCETRTLEASVNSGARPHMFLVMGRKTRAAMPAQTDGCHYIVITSLADAPVRFVPGVEMQTLFAASAEDVLTFARTFDSGAAVFWVVGGFNVFRQFVPHADSVHVVRIDEPASVWTPHTRGLTRFVADTSGMLLTSQMSRTCYDDVLARRVRCIFSKYSRKKCADAHERTDVCAQVSCWSLSPSDRTDAGDAERQYLRILARVLECPLRETRNAHTRAYFSDHMKFRAQSHAFPLLTTKRVFFRGVVEELLWFLRGQTDAGVLAARGVHVWRGNTSRAFLDANGHGTYVEGDTGPMYGFQWRHYGAKYRGCGASYAGEGIDQLRHVIEIIERDPASRRLVLTAFNPAQADEGVLYPCHSLVVQFFVESQGDRAFEVSVHMYQRSADVFLGLPFNIASTTLLLHVLCDYLTRRGTGTYVPADVAISLGDIHLYEQHTCAAREQLSRRAHTPPRLRVSLQPQRNIEDMGDYTYDDLHLENYTHEPPIAAEMVA